MEGGLSYQLQRGVLTKGPRGHVLCAPSTATYTHVGRSKLRAILTVPRAVNTLMCVSGCEHVSGRLLGLCVELLGQVQSFSIYLHVQLLRARTRLSCTCCMRMTFLVVRLQSKYYGYVHTTHDLTGARYVEHLYRRVQH